MYHRWKQTMPTESDPAPTTETQIHTLICTFSLTHTHTVYNSSLPNNPSQTHLQKIRKKKRIYINYTGM